MSARESNGQAFFAVPKWALRTVVGAVILAVPLWVVQILFFYWNLQALLTQAPVWNQHVNEAALIHEKLNTTLSLMNQSVMETKKRIDRHVERSVPPAHSEH